MLDKKKQEFDYLINFGLAEKVAEQSRVLEDIRFDFKLHDIEIDKINMSDYTIQSDLNVQIKIQDLRTSETIVTNDFTVFKLPILTELGFKIDGTWYQVQDSYTKATGWSLYEGKRDDKGFTPKILKLNLKSMKGLTFSNRKNGSIYFEMHKKVELAEFLVGVTGLTVEELIDKLGSTNKLVIQNFNPEESYPVEKCRRTVLNALYKNTDYLKGIDDNEVKNRIDTFFFGKTGTTDFGYRLALDKDYRRKTNLKTSFKKVLGTTALGSYTIGDYIIEDGQVITEKDVEALDKSDLTEIRVIKDNIKHTAIRIKSEDSSRITKEDLFNLINSFMLYCQGLDLRDNVNETYNKRVRTFEEIIEDEVSKVLNRIVDSTIAKYNSTKRGKIDNNISTDFLYKEIQDILGSSMESNRVKEIIRKMKLDLKDSQTADYNNTLAYAVKPYKFNSDIGDSATLEDRSLQNSHMGTVDTLNSPESKKIGLNHTRTLPAEVRDGTIYAPIGFMKHPTEKPTFDAEGNITSIWVKYLSSEELVGKLIGMWNTKFGPNGKGTQLIDAMKDGEVVQVLPSEVDYIIVSPWSLVSISTGTVSFIQSIDGKRVVMASNQTNQKIWTMGSERPYISTAMQSAYGIGTVTARELITKHININPSIKERLEEPFIKAFESEKATLEINSIFRYNPLLLNKLYKSLNINGDKELLELNNAVAVPKELREHNAVYTVNGTELEMNFNDALTLTIVESPIKLTQSGNTMPFRNSTYILDFYGTQEIINNQTVYYARNEKNTIFSSRLMVSDKPFKGSDIVVYNLDIDVNTYQFLDDMTEDGTPVLHNNGGSINELNYPIIGGEDGSMWKRFKPNPFIDYGFITPSDNLYKSDIQSGTNLRVAYKVHEGTTVDDSISINQDLFNNDTLTSVTIKQIEKDLKPDKDSRGRDNNIHYEIVSKNATKDDKGLGVSPMDVLPKVGEYIGPNQVIAKLVKCDANNKPVSETAELLEIKTDSTTKGRVLSVTCHYDYLSILVGDPSPIAKGDKLTGEHGNKGVVAKIVPAWQMPFDEDGRPFDIVLNPLGIPTRMNPAQLKVVKVAEALYNLGASMGVAGAVRMILSQFNNEAEDKLKILREKFGTHPKKLRDGRTGLYFDNEIETGIIYLSKLEHMVDEKVHQTEVPDNVNVATGRPSKGKDNEGGQKIGEMEGNIMQVHDTNYLRDELYQTKTTTREDRENYREYINAHFDKQQIIYNTTFNNKEIEQLKNSTALINDKSIIDTVDKLVEMTGENSIEVSDDDKTVGYDGKLALIQKQLDELSDEGISNLANHLHKIVGAEKLREKIMDLSASRREVLKSKIQNMQNSDFNKMVKKSSESVEHIKLYYYHNHIIAESDFVLKDKEGCNKEVDSKLYAKFQEENNISESYEEFNKLKEKAITDIQEDFYIANQGKLSSLNSNNIDRLNYLSSFGKEYSKAISTIANSKDLVRMIASKFIKDNNIENVTPNEFVEFMELSKDFVNFKNKEIREKYELINKFDLFCKSPAAKELKKKVVNKYTKDHGEMVFSMGPLTDEKISKLCGNSIALNRTESGAPSDTSISTKLVDEKIKQDSVEFNHKWDWIDLGCEIPMPIQLVKNGVFSLITAYTLKNKVKEEKITEFLEAPEHEKMNRILTVADMQYGVTANSLKVARKELYLYKYEDSDMFIFGKEEQFRKLGITDAETGVRAINRVLKETDLDDAIDKFRYRLGNIYRIESFERLQESMKIKEDIEMLKSMKEQGIKFTDYLTTKYPVCPRRYRYYKSTEVERKTLFDKAYEDIADKSRSAKPEDVLEAILKFLRIESKYKNDPSEVIRDNSLSNYMDKEASDDKGFIRECMVSTRVNNSARTVIVPESSTELSLRNVGVPFYQVLGAAIGFFTHSIIDDYRTGSVKVAPFKNILDKVLNGTDGLEEYVINKKIKYILKLAQAENRVELARVLDMSQQEIKEFDKALFDYVSSIANNRFVILCGRQPTLHPSSLMAFYVKVVRGLSLEIHTSVCTAYNADFDGDQMHWELLISEKAIKDAVENHMIDSNMIDYSDGSNLLAPTQDIQIGVYNLSMLYNNILSIYPEYKVTDKVEISAEEQEEVYNKYLSDIPTIKKDSIKIFKGNLELKGANKNLKGYELEKELANIEKERKFVENYKSVWYYNSIERLIDDVRLRNISKHSLVVYTDKQGRDYISTAGRIIFNSLLDNNAGFTDKKMVEISGDKVRVNDPLNLSMSKLFDGYKNIDLTNFYQLKWDGVIAKGDKSPSYKQLVQCGEYIIEVPTKLRYHSASKVLDNNTIELSANSTIELVDKIKKLGFLYADTSGVTIALEDHLDSSTKENALNAVEDKIKEIEELLQEGFITEEQKDKLIINLYDKLNSYISDNIMKEFRRSNNLFMLVDSGAKGKKSNIQQTCGMIGQVSGAKGILKTPVKSNYIKGLNPFEYYLCSYGTREGFSKQQVSIAQSGYASNKTAKLVEGMIVRQHDCGVDHTQAETKIEYGKLISIVRDNIYGKKLSDMVKDELYYNFTTNGVIDSLEASRRLSMLPTIDLEDDILTNKDLVVEELIGLEMSTESEEFQRVQYILDSGNIINSDTVKILKRCKPNTITTIENGEEVRYHFKYKLQRKSKSSIEGAIFLMDNLKMDDGTIKHINTVEGLYNRDLELDDDSLRDIMSEATWEYVEQFNIRSLAYRNPRVCMEENGVCASCYGTLHNIYKIVKDKHGDVKHITDLPPIGTNVGIISSTAIGEKSVQIMLDAVNQGAGGQTKAINVSDYIDGKKSQTKEGGIVASYKSLISKTSIGDLVRVVVSPMLNFRDISMMGEALEDYFNETGNNVAMTRDYEGLANFINESNKYGINVSDKTVKKELTNIEKYIDSITYELECHPDLVCVEDKEVVNAGDQVIEGYCNYDLLLHKIDEPEWGIRLAKEKMDYLYNRYTDMLTTESGVFVESRHMEIIARTQASVMAIFKELRTEEETLKEGTYVSLQKYIRMLPNKTDDCKPYAFSDRVTHRNVFRVFGDQIKATVFEDRNRYLAKASISTAPFKINSNLSMLAVGLPFDEELQKEYSLKAEPVEKRNIVKKENTNKNIDEMVKRYTEVAEVKNFEEPVLEDLELDLDDLGGLDEMEDLTIDEPIEELEVVDEPVEEVVEVEEPTITNTSLDYKSLNTSTGFASFDLNKKDESETKEIIVEEKSEESSKEELKEENTKESETEEASNSETSSESTKSSLNGVTGFGSIK